MGFTKTKLLVYFLTEIARVLLLNMLKLSLLLSWIETAFTDHNDGSFKNSVPALIRAFRLCDASYLLHRNLKIFKPQLPWIIYAKSILDEGDRVHVFFSND